MKEDWVSLEDLGFDDYSVSSLGRVLNKITDRIMALSKNQQGFYKVSLIRPSAERSTVQLNRLVAHAFLPGYTDIFNTPIHLDGNKEHVWVENLTWRPRWFSLKYHAQFLDRLPYVPEPIIDIDTKERFSDSLAAAAKYGLLEKDVFLSTSNHRHVFPTGQEFRILRE